MRRRIDYKILALSIKEFLKDDNDFPLCIVGVEGAGKSTLAIHISRHIDPVFSVARNILFAPTVEQATQFFLNELKGSSPCFDEFGDVAYKMDFGTTLSKLLKKFFMKNRQSNMAPIFCIPNFMDMDSYYRKRIKLLIFVYRRGKFVSLKPLKYNVFDNDVWQEKYNLKMWNDILRGKPVKNDKQFLRIIRKWSIYYGEGSFPKLTAGIEKEYKELKRAYYETSGAEASQEVQLRDSKKTLLVKKIVSGLISFGVPTKLMAEYLGLSSHTVNSYSKIDMSKDDSQKLQIMLSKAYKFLLKNKPPLQNKDLVNSKNADTEPVLEGINAE